MEKKTYKRHRPGRESPSHTMSENENSRQPKRLKSEVRREPPLVRCGGSQQGTWSVLPSYPDTGLCSAYSTASYVTAGTKLFVSTKLARPTADCSICCFDFAAPDPKWRRVPSLCQGGPLPFEGQALAVDTQHTNKKLLFSVKHNYYYQRSSVLVHLMSLDENQESISQMLEVNMPAELPRQPLPSHCHFFHLEGNNVLLVITSLEESTNDSGIYTGAATLFQFEFDISKVDKGRKNCFTGQFQPLRIFEYHTSPDCMTPPKTLGCFLL